MTVPITPSCENVFSKSSNIIKITEYIVDQFKVSFKFAIVKYQFVKYRKAQMFKNLRQKLSNLLDNRPRPTRSESLKVQSKTKILNQSINQKRESSLSKKQPPIIEITPKKCQFKQQTNQDEVETDNKRNRDSHLINKVIDNKNWLDFVSEMGSINQNSPQQLLLPTKEESKQLEMWNSLNMTNIATKKQSIVPIQEFAIQQKKDTMTSVNQNKSILSHNNSINKKIRAKIDRINKGFCPDHKECMICGEQIQCQKDSTLLSCAHRVHSECIAKMKVKNLYKCNICERRRFRDRRK